MSIKYQFEFCSLHYLYGKRMIVSHHALFQTMCKVSNHVVSICRSSGCHVHDAKRISLTNSLDLQCDYGIWPMTYFINEVPGSAKWAWRITYLINQFPRSALLYEHVALSWTKSKKIAMNWSPNKIRRLHFVPIRYLIQLPASHLWFSRIGQNRPDIRPNRITIGYRCDVITCKSEIALCSSTVVWSCSSVIKSSCKMKMP